MQLLLLLFGVSFSHLTFAVLMPCLSLTAPMLPTRLVLLQRRRILLLCPSAVRPSHHRLLELFLALLGLLLALLLSQLPLLGSIVLADLLLPRCALLDLLRGALLRGTSMSSCHSCVCRSLASSLLMRIFSCCLLRAISCLSWRIASISACGESGILAAIAALLCSIILGYTNGVLSFSSASLCLGRASLSFFISLSMRSPSCAEVI